MKRFNSIFLSIFIAFTCVVSLLPSQVTQVYADEQKYMYAYLNTWSYSRNSSAVIEITVDNEEIADGAYVSELRLRDFNNYDNILDANDYTISQTSDTQEVIQLSNAYLDSLEANTYKFVVINADTDYEEREVYLEIQDSSSQKDWLSMGYFSGPLELPYNGSLNGTINASDLSDSNYTFTLIDASTHKIIKTLSASDYDLTASSSGYDFSLKQDFVNALGVGYYKIKVENSNYAGNIEFTLYDSSTNKETYVDVTCYSTTYFYTDPITGEYKSVPFDAYSSNAYQHVKGKLGDTDVNNAIQSVISEMENFAHGLGFTSANMPEIGTAEYTDYESFTSAGYNENNEFTLYYNITHQLEYKTELETEARAEYDLTDGNKLTFDISTFDKNASFLKTFFGIDSSSADDTYYFNVEYEQNSYSHKISQVTDVNDAEMILIKNGSAVTLESVSGASFKSAELYLYNDGNVWLSLKLGNIPAAVEVVSGKDIKRSIQWVEGKEGSVAEVTYEVNMTTAKGVEYVISESIPTFEINGTTYHFGFTEGADKNFQASAFSEKLFKGLTDGTDIDLTYNDKVLGADFVGGNGGATGGDSFGLSLVTNLTSDGVIKIAYSVDASYDNQKIVIGIDNYDSDEIHFILKYRLKVLEQVKNTDSFTVTFDQSKVVSAISVYPSSNVYGEDLDNSSFDVLKTTKLSDMTLTYPVTATDNENTKSYTVKWLNEDGSVLSQDTVNDGNVPSYSGVTPTKKSDAQYTYTFSGWDKTVSAVTEDTVYTAQYKKTINTYTVTWLNTDGSTLKTDTVEYGVTPKYEGTPYFENDLYIFSKWDKEITAVTGDVTYIAIYTYEPETNVEIKKGITTADISKELIDIGFDTSDKIRQALLEVSSKLLETDEPNSVLMDVKLMQSDDGETWYEVTKDNFPKEGLTVVLPYPEGTNSQDYAFVVVHMFGETANGHIAGETEIPAVTKTENGLVVKLTGTSPVMISYKEIKKIENPSAEVKDNTSSTTTTKTTSTSKDTKTADTSDYSSIVLYASVLLFSLMMFIFGIIQRKRYQ